MRHPQAAALATPPDSLSCVPVIADQHVDSEFSFTDPPSWHTAAPSRGGEDGAPWRAAWDLGDEPFRLDMRDRPHDHPDPLFERAVPPPPPLEDGRAFGGQPLGPAAHAPPLSRSRRFLRWSGLLDVGRSHAQPHGQRLVAGLTRPVRGSRTIAVISTKGGVGKTSVTVNLGHLFAEFRDDRVIALDANPDGGSLTYRIPRETRSTITELLDDLGGLDPSRLHHSDVRRYTSQASSRLEVLASPQDPHASRTLGQEQYRQALDLLRRHYTLILADCGTGILDTGTRAVIEAADQLILVTAPSIDAARAVNFLLSWLTAHGHAHLVKDAVLVMNAVARRTGPVNLIEMERHFAQRVRKVIQVPWDPHLETGARTAMQDLRPETRQAYLRLAAATADGLLSPAAHEPARTEHARCACQT
ncbi:MAG: MinD/ParA family ATP-binding protein [Egibacteraceae bacterium]